MMHASLCFLFLLNPGSLNVQGIDPGKEKESRCAAQRLSPEFLFLLSLLLGPGHKL